jgi:ribosome biogenesis protein SSF1/2
MKTEQKFQVLKVTKILTFHFLNFRKNDEKVRKIQEAQRKKKEEVKEQHREKSMEGMKRKQDKEALGKFAENEEEAAEDDDAEYYRSEVGQEPEKGITYSESDLKERSFNDYFDFRSVYCTCKKYQIISIWTSS